MTFRTMDPTKLKLTQLQDICINRGLTTNGNKAEVIRRLQEADPTDEWLRETNSLLMGDWSDENDYDVNEETADSLMQSYSGGMQGKEVNFLRRERDLIRWELELTRRELELSRASPASATIQQVSPHVNINTLKDLLSDFLGIDTDFRKWKNQFKLLKSTYKLDDNHGHLLMGSKLKGKALKWFHSRDADG